MIFPQVIMVQIRMLRCIKEIHPGFYYDSAKIYSSNISRGIAKHEIV
jgi:hypothetical protein